MARPKSKDPRTETIGARVTPVTKARIAERAHAAGMKVSEFIVHRALGEKPRHYVKPEPVPRRAPAEAAAAILIEREEVRAEVAEAQLDDPAAREAFIARRAQQLHGQGKTMPVARSLASQEWATRGTKSA